MATMKVDATAENKPAYFPKGSLTSRPKWIKGGETHEDQGGLQVSAMFLQKFTVVLVRFAFVFGVEVELGVAGWFKAGKEVFLGVLYGTLQTGSEKRRVVEEPGAGVARWFKAGEVIFQGISYGILQTRSEKRGKQRVGVESEGMVWTHTFGSIVAFASVLVVPSSIACYKKREED